MQTTYTETKQKADISNLREGTGVANARMEDDFYKEVTAFTTDFKTPVILRIYCKANGTQSACIWINGRDGKHGHGGWKGRSNNVSWGYHKSSEAAGMAIYDAGIKLAPDISGCGDYAIREAVEAIAKAVTGKRNIHIHEAHA